MASESAEAADHSLQEGADRLSNGTCPSCASPTSPERRKEPLRRYSLAQVPKNRNSVSRHRGSVSQHDARQLLMAEHIYHQCRTAGWFADPEFTNVVAVRSSIGEASTSKYTTWPPSIEVEAIDIFLNGLASLNCEAALIMGGHLVRTLLASLDDNVRIVALADDVNLEIVDTLEEFGSVKRHQYATFVHSHTALITWSVDVDALIPNTHKICNLILQYLWQVPAADVFTDVKDQSCTGGAILEKDIEANKTVTRSIGLISPLHVGLACGINILVCCNTIATLIHEFYLDRSWPRLLILIAIPLQACVSQFFCVIVVAVILQLLGPVAQMHQNSRYYSGKRPTRMKGPLPPFTILMPVYKEGLESVLQPTINSLQAAIQTYELQGGSVNILVCDDGMQLLNADDFAVRKAFYDANTIAYVARPKHSKNYNRAGRFKKASNLNVALELSIRVETLMADRRPQLHDKSHWAFLDEHLLYNQCLADALKETERTISADNRDQPTTLSVWASGNIRIGELVLIIDSDTRVPEDCFLDAASEMHASPECAIIQHASDVMFVANHFFENGIAFFTRLVNTSISWVCSNGDVGCFVGHNAFIRWSALQEIATQQPDGRWAIWSESHVSEDFDCALRMLVAGYDVRWASYSNGGFKEGVSLTAVDEINRWQKYAFGVSELLFHPIKFWLFRGPFTPMAKFFFLESNLPIHYKFSALAYMLSYYGISVAFPLTLLNYILYGLFIPSLDNVYLPSWQVNVALFVVFGCASALGFAILRYRCGEADLVTAFWEQAKWTPFNTIFFMGLSFHVGLALIAHLIGYNMTWSSTVKEADESATVFTELPAIFNRFRLLFSLCMLCILMILLFNFIYTTHQEWNIIDWVSIFPLALLIFGHVLYAFVLNPTVMGMRF